MRMTVEVLDEDLPPLAKVQLTTRGCDYTLHAGDLIFWKRDLTEVGNLGNPNEMDYAAYLLHEKGIRYEQHLPLNQVFNGGSSPTLMNRMANTRRAIEHMVFNSGLSQSSQRFIIALLLGDSHHIDRSTRAEFSSAGIAHVLALSGLHIGIIALIIWWLLFPLDYIQMKKTRLVVTLLSIACFALFTGLSSSVIRSAIMIGFTFMALFFSRRYAPINSLLMSALLIMVFSPASIFSVGFQLSFITVGTVLIMSDITTSFNTGSRIIDRFISIVTTSLVVLIATLSLTAHYFHTISLASVISNLLVLPVLPFFMILGCVFLLITLAGFRWSMLEQFIDLISDYIHWVAKTVNDIPFSHAQSVYVSTTGTIIYFIVIILVAVWIYQRNYRYLLAAGCALVILLGHSLWIDAHTPRRGLVIFNAFTSTPVLYYDHGRGYVWVPDDPDGDITLLSRFYDGFLSAHGIGEVRLIGNDSTVRLQDALFKPPHAYLYNHRLAIAGSGKWKSKSAIGKMKVEEVILSKHYRGSIARLRELYEFDRIIISGAMQRSSLMPLMHECDSLGITPHVLERDGAYEVQ